MDASLEVMRPPVITSWFRDNPTLRVVQSQAREFGQSTPLRVASVGCATGGEPYSLAYLLRQNGQQGKVFAYDIDEQAIDKAKNATYTRAGIQWDAPDIPIDDMFEQTELGQLIVRQDIRDMVEFDTKNFITEDVSIDENERFDIVSCRNLLQHFAVAPDTLETAITRLADMTRENGILLLDRKAFEVMMLKSSTSLHILDTYFAPLSPDNPKIWRKKVKQAS